MPVYGWLATNHVDFSRTGSKLGALHAVGVPYTDAQIQGAADEARSMARRITADLKENGVDADPESELVAMIAYLQRLGLKRPPAAPAPAAPAPAAAPAAH